VFFLLHRVKSAHLAKDGADGDLDEYVVTPFASLAFPLSVFTPAGANDALSRQFVQTGEAVDGLYEDVPTAATVASVGRTFFNILFAQERDTAITSGSGDHGDEAFILEDESRVIRGRGIGVQKFGL
jgi:hypothetical protein